MSVHSHEIRIKCWQFSELFLVNHHLHQWLYRSLLGLGRFWQFLDRIYTVGRLCGLVVRVLGYRSGGSGSIPDTTRIK
jgi:hypothetical protein